VTITHPSLGGTGTNTWHARTDGVDDAGDATLQDLIDALETFYSSVTAIVAGQTTFATDGTWIRVDGDEATIIDKDGFSVTAGTSQGPLPPANCLVAGWRTAVASRSGKGRTFIGPMGTSTLQDNGSPTESTRDALAAAGEALIDSFDGIANGALAVWSVKDQVARDLVSVAVANEFAVLRSRRD